MQQTSSRVNDLQASNQNLPKLETLNPGAFSLNVLEHLVGVVADLVNTDNAILANFCFFCGCCWSWGRDFFSEAQPGLNLGSRTLGSTQVHVQPSFKPRFNLGSRTLGSTKGQSPKESRAGKPAACVGLSSSSTVFPTHNKEKPPEIAFGGSKAMKKTNKQNKIKEKRAFQPVDGNPLCRPRNSLKHGFLRKSASCKQNFCRRAK